MRDVLRVKMWEGLFDAPYRPLTNADAAVLSPENVAVAKRAARESLVLLKNENSLLPLDAGKIKSIALCGPDADNPDYAHDHYGPLATHVVTVREALTERFGSAAVRYSRRDVRRPSAFPGRRADPRPAGRMA